MTLLLQKGADVNARDLPRRTPLHLAARRGSRAVVELLLAKGADAEAKDMEGGTPADLAAAVGHDGQRLPPPSYRTYVVPRSFLPERKPVTLPRQIARCLRSSAANDRRITMASSSRTPACQA